MQGSSKFDAKRIAEVRLHHESHLIRKSEDKLQLRWDGDKKWIDVKGELFKPVGSSSYFPDVCVLCLLMHMINQTADLWRPWRLSID